MDSTGRESSCRGWNEQKARSSSAPRHCEDAPAPATHVLRTFEKFFDAVRPPKNRSDMLGDKDPVCTAEVAAGVERQEHS